MALSDKQLEGFSSSKLPLLRRVAREQIQGTNLANNAGDSRNSFMDMINEITARGRGMADQPALTAEDLFGDQMRRVEDSARQNANSLKSAISRSLMSGGGDISGVAGGQLLNVGQNMQQQIGDQRLQFSKLADQISRAQEGRGLNLMQSGLQGTQNLAGMDRNVFEQFRNRQIQAEQARKQRRAAIIGNIIGTIGQVAACWVAMELYGDDDKKTYAIREFLYDNKGEDNFIGEFLDAYEEYGRAWAENIKDNPILRGEAKALFDDLYNMATGG